MYDKLLCQSCTYKLHMEEAFPVISCKCSQCIKHFISDKLRLFRCEYNVKQFFLEKESHYTESHSHEKNPDDGSTQLVKMVPKCHSPSFEVLSLSLSPSLNERTPLPSPFISSGIFLPPKKRSTTKAIRSTS